MWQNFGYSRGGVRNHSLPYRPRSGDSVKSQRFGFLGKAFLRASTGFIKACTTLEKKPLKVNQNLYFVKKKVNYLQYHIVSKQPLI